MKIKKHLFILSIAGLILAAPALFAAAPGQALLEKAQEMKRPRYEFAVQNGAKTGLTPDGKSFYVLWLPAGADPQNPPPMVVTISGHSGWAFEDFYVWHPFIKDRGYGLLALQWWFGENQSPSGYLTPREMYPSLDAALSEAHVKPGTALFHGFSRGATNTYAVAALDRASGKNYFALFIANAGKANSNYLPIHEIETGAYGEKPLAGTRWVTFGGGKDPNPDRDGIEGMRAAGRWIENQGGKVELAIEDPASGHGGFHRNPKNTESALDLFEKLRAH